MVSTSKIKHKKRYVQNEDKKPQLPQFFHPAMKNNKLMLADRGLIERLTFSLEIKVYGDPQNPLEASLREKFERQIKNLNIGDGRTTFKVSKLKEI